MLLVNEIYPAICGESRFSGHACTLVRLTGCHIRCSWCDSAHSFAGGETLTVEAVVQAVREQGFKAVLVTGGEPLLQKDLIPLLEALLADNREILLETSGTLGPANMLPLAAVPAEVHKVVDVKAPGSAISAQEIDWAGIADLGPRDELKFVCADRKDYEWSRDLVLAAEKLPAGVRVAFSPVQGDLTPRELAEWILADKLDVVFQIQLHKAVWPDVERGV
ncbi:MAG: radical SAM protein [Candidatus Krumholzibacteria bacterium]|nr:radical SAM protein [Candidatus Krumholzibacteria bacterium]